MEKRDLKVFPRPVGLVCDEAQHFVSPKSFALFQATARSMRVSSCLATQALGALETQLGKTDAQSLISNLNLKIFCSSDDYPTNTWASQMIGEAWGLTGNTNVSLDTDRKKRANFDREDGATRPVSGSHYGTARTPDGLSARSFFARSNFEVEDVA